VSILNAPIKAPGKRNIKKTAGIYNAKKGRGIEVFYNIRRGKLLIADYYRNCNEKGYRKLPTVAGDVRMPAVTPEYLTEQIQLIKDNERKERIAEKKRDKEQIARYKAQRRAYYREKFKLSKSK